MAKFTSQKYFDSAQDYRWEVVRASLERRKFLVRYDPLDSYDSSRRTLFKMIHVPPLFDDSDLTSLIEVNAAEAVWKWNLGREEDTSWDLRSYQGLKGTSTFPGLIIDSYRSQDSLNPLLQTYETTNSIAPGGQVQLNIAVVALSDSDREVMRESLIVPLPNVWEQLSDEGRIDSTFEMFNIDSFGNLDPVDVQFLREQSMQFGDSVSNQLQNMYGYNDSDWAHWMFYEAGV